MSLGIRGRSESRLPAAGKFGTSGREGRGASNGLPLAPADEDGDPLKIAASSSSAACSQRRSTTYIPVGVDSGLRRNDGEG